MTQRFVRENRKTVRKFVEAAGRAIEWARQAPRAEVIARMTAIVKKRGMKENAEVIKYWKSYGVAGAHGRLTDKDFQIWIEWMVRDGEVTAGQLTPKQIYTNE